MTSLPNISKALAAHYAAEWINRKLRRPQLGLGAIALLTFAIVAPIVEILCRLIAN